MDERTDLLASVLPLARALRRVEEDAANRHGLTMWQYAVLAVADADASATSSQAEIAERLGYSRNRIIADIDELERLGLARRVPGTDRRRHEIVVSAAGRRRMRSIRADIHRAEDEVFASLPATDRRTFEALARRHAAAVRAAAR